MLAACCKEVITLDPDPDLSFAARAALESCGVTNVKTVSTAAVDGWKDEAPYDVILLNGAAEIVPEAWLAQLAPGGRLGVIVRQGAAGSARIYTRADDAAAYRSRSMRRRRLRRDCTSRRPSRSEMRVPCTEQRREHAHINVPLFDPAEHAREEGDSDSLARVHAQRAQVDPNRRDQ